MWGETFPFADISLSISKARSCGSTNLTWSYTVHTSNIVRSKGKTWVHSGAHNPFIPLHFIFSHCTGIVHPLDDNTAVVLSYTTYKYICVQEQHRFHSSLLSHALQTSYLSQFVLFGCTSWFSFDKTEHFERILFNSECIFYFFISKIVKI